MIKSFLENTSFVLLIAILLSIFFPFFCHNLKLLIPLFLITAMTLSTLQIQTKKLNPLKRIKPLCFAVLLNYFVQGLVVLFPAFLFIQNNDYLTGFIVFASAPVAVAVVPYTFLLKGNTEFSTIADTVIHFLAIILMPAILLFFFAQTINPLKLLSTITLLILLPLIISRILRRINIVSWKYSRVIVNLSIGIIVYTLVALNHSTITSLSAFPLDVTIIILFKFLIFSTLLFFLLKRFCSKEDAISFTLLASYKNNALAATVALLLFTDASTIPIALTVIFDVLMLIYFEHLFKRFS